MKPPEQPRKPKPLSHIRHREEVAARLVMTLEALNLEVADVSRFLGISTSKFGNWTAPRNYPDVFLMTRFCERYGVTMEWIYRGAAYGLPAELADNLALAWAEKRAEMETRAHRPA